MKVQLTARDYYMNDLLKKLSYFGIALFFLLVSFVVNLPNLNQSNEFTMFQYLAGIVTGIQLWYVIKTIILFLRS